jgi:hypothetical protein
MAEAEVRTLLWPGAYLTEQSKFVRLVLSWSAMNSSLHRH